MGSFHGTRDFPVSSKKKNRVEYSRTGFIGTILIYDLHMCKEASGLGTHFLKTLKYKKRVRFFFFPDRRNETKKKKQRKKSKAHQHMLRNS
jgi:hypothetical protein